MIKSERKRMKEESYNERNYKVRDCKVYKGNKKGMG